MLEQNPIYDFMKSNKLTDLDEKTFLSKYSAPDKAKEIHSFFVENDLTDLDSAKFYDKYLKKKELSVPSGEVSSPTELLSVSQDISLTPKPTKKDYYSTKLEKGLIFDKKGQLYAPSSEALSKNITPADQASLKKSTQKDLVEKSREMPVVVEPTEPIEKQGWLLNTVSALDKGFAKNFLSSPIKGLGTILQGATKKVMGGTGEGDLSNALIKFGDYLNNAIDELTPQDEEFKNTLTDQVAQAFGQVGSLVATGAISGLGKGATTALVSQAPKGALVEAAKTIGSELATPTAISGGLSMGQAEFDRAKQAGATDDQAFEAFYKNAAVGSVLETIPVMQFFKRFNKATAGSVANYIKTKGVEGLTGGIEEMTTEVIQQLYSNKTAKDIYNINQSILDGVGSSGGIGFGVGFLLNAMGANAKILRKEGKPQEATAIENQIKQYEDNLKNPKVTSGDKESVIKIVTKGEAGADEAVVSLDKDLANNVITPKQHQEGLSFVEKAFQVYDKIPEIVTGESRAKSIELLVERNDIKQANDNLLQQKQTADEAYHAGIDEEIKANEERIKKIDSEVYNIAKKPSKEFGTKRYEIDGEEVSKEAFEALTGKPIGTKEIIAAEVKPVETYEDKVKQILINQSGVEGYEYRGNPSDLAKIPIEDVKSDVNEALKSFKNQTIEGLPYKTAYRLKAEFEAKGYGDIPNGTKLEDIKDKIDSLKPSDGRLLEDDIYKRRKKELDSLSLLPMVPKDEMTPELEKKAQDRRDEIKKINDKYDAELAALKVKPVVKVKEEVKPTEVKVESKEEQPIGEVNPTEDINKANVTIEGTTDGYKVISGDKANSIGDIRQEANEARKKGQDTFTKETVKDGKRIFTLTDTTVSDNFGRPGFKSASISFPEGTKITMEDVMPKLKSELGIKEEVKPTEVKQEVKVKAPTKELAEGESIEFKTIEGNKVVGEKVIIPGFEKIDMVMVKDGFNNTVYDLASGMPMVEGEFSKEGAIKSIKEQLDKRNVTQGKLYGTIYKGNNTSSFENKNRVRQINPSSMFESYSEKRKAYDKAEYEKLPLKYTPKEIEELNKLKDKAIKNGLDKIASDIDKRIEERGTENKVNYYDSFDRAINYGIEEKAKKEAEKNKVPYPEEYIEPVKGTEESLAKVMMSGKKDKLSQVNPDVKKAIVDAWGKYADLYNKYGYKFSESMDEFVTSLLRYSGTLNAEKNREERLAIEQKRLKSSIEEMNKVYEKEFGKKAEAELKPKEGEVKVYNAKDLKENPKVLEEDKDYYSLTYPKSFVKLFTDMVSLKNNGFENAKIGDVINIFKKDYVIGGFIENKKNPNKTSVKLIRVDNDGNLLREQDLTKKEQKEGRAKEFEEEEEIEVEKPELTKDDLKKAEAKFAAAEDKFKKARNKIEATQVKQAGMFGGEQKGMFAMGGEEAKKTLEPLRKAAKEAKAELDDIRNRIKVQEQAQPELKPIGIPQSIKDMAQALRDFDKIINLSKAKGGGNKTAGTEVYQKAVALINEKKTHKFTGKGWEDVSEAYYKALKSGNNPELVKLIDNALAKETPYQKALKEKQQEEKKRNREIGSEKAIKTKEIFRKLSQTDRQLGTDEVGAQEIALRYLADGGMVSENAINEAYGTVKRAELNTGRKEVRTTEVRAKDYVGGKETLEGLAHRLWEANDQRVPEDLIRDALMSEIGSSNTRLEAAEAYLEQYSAEYIAEKEEMRLAEQEKEMYLEEQEKLEEELREPLNQQIEGEESEEHVNNLIDQYESEIKREDQQFGPKSEGEINKETGKGKVSEKTQKTELAKEFKEATSKASKKAKENAKKDFVDRNFEDIKEKLKIEIKCPT